MSFAHKLQSEEVGEEEEERNRKIPVTTAIPLTDAQIPSKYVTYMSVEVYKAVTVWKCTAILQAGVDIIECVQDEEGVTLYSTIIPTNHNIVNYIFDSIPTLAPHHVTVSEVQDFMELVEFGCMADGDAVWELNQLPLSVQSLLGTIKNVNEVVCISYTAELTVIQGNVVGNNTNITATASNNSNNSNNLSSHRRLSKYERKQLKHTGAPNNSNINNNTVTNTAIVSTNTTNTNTRIYTERFHVLVQCVSVNMHMKVGNTLSYRIQTPIDMCGSIFDILSTYVTNKNIYM